MIILKQNALLYQRSDLCSYPQRRTFYDDTHGGQRHGQLGSSRIFHILSPWILLDFVLSLKPPDVLAEIDGLQVLVLYLG